ncbi:exodeoxyribonuclease VII small subunit [Trichocoleus sp. FACHB-591]|uniref:exodeoxyribonuclease VII small subunit n=1 Tax=Trichocoleus sp. FACHB-591 TaxID=2692872 RepID=UPI001681D146|nr:exodeoxyribonuclease VII small subunit [Trichocoleus sp. FACHB-591]MBD2097180.1 exodeoxyribonuclease VII small subunit [Trichocoleus sp. FACHB-591]
MNDLTSLNQSTSKPTDTVASANSPSTSSQTDWSYETTVDQIETIIGQIEAGDLDLVEVFDQFAIAIDQLRQCETFLRQRQQQMDLLIEKLVDEFESY